MNERTDFDRLLTTWLVADAPRTPPDDLLTPVRALTSTSRPMPTWRALLSVPPMRTQSTVLVGSPTLRLARVVVALIVLAGLIACGAVVGAGLIEPPDRQLAFGGACQPTLPGSVVARVDGDHGSTATHALLSDGRFLRVSSSPSGDVSRTARRMTDAGVRLYLDAIRDAGLTGDCRRLYGRTLPSYTRLRAAVDGELIDTIYEGGGMEGAGMSATFHALDADEQAAADTLIKRLAYPETWLPSEAWLVSDEQLLVGSEAIAVWDFITDAEWEPESGLTVEWPQAAAEAPGTGQLGVEPCRLLGPARIATIIPGAWSPVGGGLLNEALPGGGIRCWFQDLPEGAEWADLTRGEAPHYSGAKYWTSFAVTVRSVPTDRAEAATLVAELFGPTQPEEGTTGGQLWINDCFSAGCTPAIAITSDPYFVLLTEVPDMAYGRDQMRSLGVEVLRELGELARDMNP